MDYLDTKRDFIFANSRAIDRLMSENNDRLYGASPVNSGSNHSSNWWSGFFPDMRSGSSCQTNAAHHHYHCHHHCDSGRSQNVNNFNINTGPANTSNNTFESDSSSKSKASSTDIKREKEEEKKGKLENPGMTFLLSSVGSLLATYLVGSAWKKYKEIKTDLRKEIKTAEDLWRAKDILEFDSTHGNAVNISRNKNQPLMKSELEGARHGLVWRGMLLSSSAGAVAASVVNSSKLLTASAVGALLATCYPVFLYATDFVASKNRRILKKWQNNNPSTVGEGISPNVPKSNLMERADQLRKQSSK